MTSRMKRQDQKLSFLALVTICMTAPLVAVAQPSYSTVQPVYPSKPAPNNHGQTNRPYVPYYGPRDNFGIPLPEAIPSQRRPDFYAVCNQRAASTQWGQQVDSHITRQLNGSDWASAFSAYGNAYARNQSEMQAKCMAVQQYDAVAHQWGGLESTPPDILRALDRNLYIAFVVAPQADAQRRADTTNRRVQEQAADSLLRGLGRRRQ
jgi:hypothetical protein